MDVTLLRKLSHKSTLQFGKYADNTVQNLIDLKHYRYLRWCYFNLDMISFLDNILDEINIPIEFRINKPGKLPENHNKLNAMHDNNSNGGGLSGHIERRIKKAQRKHEAKQISKAYSFKFSKANLQRINHGHKK